MSTDHIPKARVTDYTQVTEAKGGKKCNFRNSTEWYGHDIPWNWVRPTGLPVLDAQEL